MNNVVFPIIEALRNRLRRTELRSAKLMRSRGFDLIRIIVLSDDYRDYKVFPQVATLFFVQYEYFCHSCNQGSFSCNPLLNLHKIHPRPREIASDTIL